MSGAALIMRGVRKSYGNNRALDGLDLEIPAGTITGFIGPNGAGKTTTFAIASGAVKADAGEIDILGMGPFDPAKHAGRLSVLPQDCALSAHTPVRELLIFYARLQGMTSGEAARDADRVLDEVALSDRAGARIRQLSHGMRRRVAVGQALLGDPALVLLDEPTSGLDPHLVVRMRDVFLAQRGRRSLIISSHVLAELEAVCDHVVFVERGRCVGAGPLHELTGRGEVATVLLASAAMLDAALAAVGAAAPEVHLTGADATLTATAPPGWSLEQLNRAVLGALLGADVGVLELRAGQSLEQRYMQARTTAGIS